MNKFDREITDKVVSELNKRKIKQVQLINLCKQKGMIISQPDVSKIYSGKKTLNLHQFAVICRLLDLPMESFVWDGKDRHREDFCDPHDSKTLHDSGSELECYIGEYYLYYLSTASGEDKLLKGRLSIKEEKGFCGLSLFLDTGEDDRHGNRIIKKYSGRILVSNSLGTAYLIFKSESIGEICMICLRHRSYSLKMMQCRIGLSLTASAGEEKVPTVHRCLLLREDVEEMQSEEIRPWLNLIHENISIEKDMLEIILEEKEKEFPRYSRQLNHIKESAVSREVAEISIENMRRQLPMDRKEFMGLLSLLYDKSDAVRNYKVSQSDDIRFYEKMDSLKKEAMQTGMVGSSG